MVDKRFIVNMHGKDFVLYEGLLDLAHQHKLSDVDTDILQYPTEENGRECVVKARVKTERGCFSGTGKASPKNVSGPIVNHLESMAETRAIARALRVATNVGMTAFEEIGPQNAPESPQKQDTGEAATEKQVELICQLLENPVILPEEKEKTMDAIDALTKARASQLIERIKDKIDARMGQ